MRVDGSCHCGEITYRAEADPDQVLVCHCTDCQVLGGTAFRTALPVSAEAFTLQSGEPRIYVKTAESGKRRAQAFCPTCGTPLYATDAQQPQILALRVAALRQRDALPPRRQIWYRSAQPWVLALDRIIHCERD
jgi:hypothetical protein